MMLSAKELKGAVPARLPLGEQRRVVIEGEERVIPRKRGHKRRTTEAMRRRQRAYEERHGERILEIKRNSAKRRYWDKPEQFRAESRASMKRWWAKMMKDPAKRAEYYAKQAKLRKLRQADPEWQAKNRAYKAAWRAKRKAMGLKP